jgi:hypothetical protein
MYELVMQQSKRVGIKAAIIARIISATAVHKLRTAFPYHDLQRMEQTAQISPHDEGREKKRGEGQEKKREKRERKKNKTWKNQILPNRAIVSPLAGRSPSPTTMTSFLKTLVEGP